MRIDDILQLLNPAQVVEDSVAGKYSELWKDLTIMLSYEFARNLQEQMLPRVQIAIFLRVLPLAGCPARLREDEERDAAIGAGG